MRRIAWFGLLLITLIAVVGPSIALAQSDPVQDLNHTLPEATNDQFGFTFEERTRWEEKDGVNFGKSVNQQDMLSRLRIGADYSPVEWFTISAMGQDARAPFYGASMTVSNGSFPLFLGGTSVTINGKPAYLSFVSPGQINVQAPDDTTTGPVQVTVTTAGGTAASQVTLSQYAPSFLLLDSTHVAGIILRFNGTGAYGRGTYDILGPTGNSLGYPTVAAKAGDLVELYGTGFGPTSPAVPSGHYFSGAAPATSPVSLQINNTILFPSFAGLSGAGLDQINLTIPPNLGSGDVSLAAAVGGAQTPSGVVISLQ